MTRTPPDAAASLTVRPVRLAETLRMHRVGTFDPTARFGDHAVAVAFRLGGAPVVLELAQTSATTIEAAAWGPRADEVLAFAGPMAGNDDDAESFQPTHEGLARLVRQNRGLRLPRVPWIFELMVSAILQQRVAFQEAARAFRALAIAHGDPAPGPHGLRALPAPKTLATLPSHAYRAAWIDLKRERVVRELSSIAGAIEAHRAAPVPVLRELLSIRGVGPWTLESAMGWGLGDADAVPTGDYWLPHGVVKAFRGKERATDEEMLEVLEPFRPHRFRVIRVLFASGRGAPRHGPRRHTGLTPRRT